MKVLVVGAGAREHALSAALMAHGDCAVVCAPGNAGIARDVPVRPLDASDPDAVLALAVAEQVDLTVIGPEAPLAAGVADRFAAAGRPLFGPSRAAAQLETSKAFAKALMARHGVPTAKAVTCDDLDRALAVVREGSLGWPVVVKADGLAAGKGVVIALNLADAEAAIRAAMVDGAFGAAGARVVLEECLTGPELSYFVIAAGEKYVASGSAQDHKRLLDDDRGPNTGGMGAFSPSVLLTPELAARIEAEVVRPVLHGMAIEGMPFTGFLYCGLMLTTDGPKVIEFNCRFGDPEAQVVLPLIDEPLAPVLAAAAAGDDLPVALRFSRDVAVGVVLAAGGYPGTLDTGHPIEGLDAARAHAPSIALRFAGVSPRGEGLVVSGGRVLTVVCRAADYPTAIDTAYAATAHVRFTGKQHRTDIGARARTASRP